MFADGSRKRVGVTSHEGSNQGTVLVELEGWQSGDAGILSNRFQVSGVHLDEVGTSQFGSERGDSWGNLVAVAAPRSPVVNNSKTRSGDGRLEVISVSDLSNSVTVTGSSGVVRILVDSVEILLGSHRVSIHGEVSWLPVGWANFTVDINKLESLHQSDDLVDISSNGEIIDSDLSELTGRRDDEESSERNAVWKEDAVLVGNNLVEIGNNGNFHVSQATLRARGVHPSQMSELRIAGSSDNLSVDGIEFVLTITEGNDLGWAHKSEI